MATIDDIATWCTSTMLKRSDLTSEARVHALSVYKLICQKIPFEALQYRSAELPMIASTAEYDLASGPTQLTPELAGIMSIRYTVAGGARTWRVRRSHTRVFDAIQSTRPGDPRMYARFGSKVEFSPAPLTSLSTFRVRYWANPAITAAPNEHQTTLVTPSAWDELFKWETLFRLYYITGETEKAAALIMPMPMPRQPSPKRTHIFEVGIIPRLWNDLLLTISQRENVDEDFAINPIRREYSNG